MRNGNSGGDAELNKDLEERDAFVRRLALKRKAEVAEKEEEAKRSRASEADERVGALNNSSRMQALRERSRREYVVKREKVVIEELAARIRDDEELFGDDITEQERQMRENDKEMLRLAIAEQNARVSQGGYYIPDGMVEEKETNAVGFGSESKEGYDSWEKQQVGRVLKEGSDPLAASEFLLPDGSKPSAQVLKQMRPEAPKRNFMEERASKREAMRKQRQGLPVYKYRDVFLEAVRKHNIIIVEGETGSGKTTQLPQYLIEEDVAKRVGCTQPRRVAAMSVAARVSEEMNVKLGEEVGYSIRFEDCTSDSTVLKYMTDGMLLREFLNDPTLAQYDCIMLDEAHERTIQTDILMGLIKELFQPGVRKDPFKLIVSSATLDIQKFSDYFGGAPILQIPGRLFDVENCFLKNGVSDYLEAVIKQVLHIHVTGDAGDILVFLTGQEEIDTAVDILNGRLKKIGAGQKGSSIRPMSVLPIYAALPSNLQAKIFEPAPKDTRKVILATNIAETSLTIDGIVYVIDPGFCKQNYYNPRTGMESLIVVPISQSSANQRSGRAGRVQSGTCYRLYTRDSYENEMNEVTEPEIMRSPLAATLLLMLSMGIQLEQIRKFDFMDEPPNETLAKSLTQLYALGAIAATGQLTKLGRKMAEFPLEPMQSKCIIASEALGCTEEILSIIAMLNAEGSLFYRPREQIAQADHTISQFFQPEGDHMTLLFIYNMYIEVGGSDVDGLAGDRRTTFCLHNFLQKRALTRAKDVRDQIAGILERVEIHPVSCTDSQIIRKALLSGYFFHVAKMQSSGAYQTNEGKEEAAIHPSSALRNTPVPLVMYDQLVLTSRHWMRYVTEVEPHWLMEAAPHYFEQDEHKRFATVQKRKKDWGKNDKKK